MPNTPRPDHIAERFRTRLETEVDPHDALGLAMSDRREDVLLLDLRDERAFAKAHVEGSVNLPYPHHEDRLVMLPQGREMWVYSYDGSNLQPYRVALALLENGYTARVVRGGHRALVEHGARLQDGQGHPVGPHGEHPTPHHHHHHHHHEDERRAQPAADDEHVHLHVRRGL